LEEGNFIGHVKACTCLKMTVQFKQENNRSFINTVSWHAPE